MHCRSKEYIDLQCPDRPPRASRTWEKKPLVSPVPVHWIPTDDEYLTHVDEQTYYCYQEMLATFEEQQSAHSTVAPDHNHQVSSPSIDTPLTSPDDTGNERSGY
jgi:hypothetical protein